MFWCLRKPGHLPSPRLRLLGEAGNGGRASTSIAVAPCASSFLQLPQPRINEQQVQAHRSLQPWLAWIISLLAKVISTKCGILHATARNTRAVRGPTPQPLLPAGGRPSFCMGAGGSAQQAADAAAHHLCGGRAARADGGGPGLFWPRPACCSALPAVLRSVCTPMCMLAASEPWICVLNLLERFP